MPELDPQLQALFRDIDAGERLHLIATRIGLALWTFQDVETSAALYFAMVARIKKGTGIEAAHALLKEAQSKPFGATIEGLRKAGFLTRELEVSFGKLRDERNWIVHRSLTESRGAVHSDAEMEKLLKRIEGMKVDAAKLLRTIETLVAAHAEKAGVSREQVQERAERTLQRWRSGKS